MYSLPRLWLPGAERSRGRVRNSGWPWQKRAKGHDHEGSTIAQDSKIGRLRRPHSLAAPYHEPTAAAATSWELLMRAYACVCVREQRKAEIHDGMSCPPARSLPTTQVGRHGETWSAAPDAMRCHLPAHS